MHPVEMEDMVPATPWWRRKVLGFDGLAFHVVINAYDLVAGKEDISRQSYIIGA